MERLLVEEKDFVLDTGASSFISLWNYFLTSQALDLLRASGRRVCIHTIIAGGGAQLETLSNFRALASTLADRELIVWINEHEAKVEQGGMKL